MPGQSPMNAEADLALFGEERPAVMVVSHERSGTHFLMNALAACYGYVSAPWVNLCLPTVNSNSYYPPRVRNTPLSLAAGAAVVSNDAHLLAVAGREGLEVVRPADVRA